MYFKITQPTIDFIKIFDEFFNETTCCTTSDSDYRISRKSPTHDVIENDDEFIVELELAGVKKDDIEINAENGTLTIDAKRNRDNDLKYNRKERYSGKFKRIFNLPDNVDTENICASYVDGILTLTIPKTMEESKKKKQIEIK